MYLGGLGEEGPGLSRHLASRREVEDALAAGGVRVTTLRAAMIVGSGSASFEILRYLVERLPVMVTPRWVDTACQPIAVRDVLHYLVACLDVPATAGVALDIGGPDVLPYRELMQIMASALGLRRRLIVPLPLLTPRLSSLWIHLVTPVGKEIARPLAEGLRNPVVCRDARARELMPCDPMSMREAIAAALGRSRNNEVETSWLDAGPIPGDPDWAGGKVFEVRLRHPGSRPGARCVREPCAGSEAVTAGTPPTSSGGYGVRLDRLVGGPGLRRGRRDPERVGFGDALDFWRVVGIVPDRKLRLRAEMRLPGVAELEFDVEPPQVPPAGCRLVQIARFKPRGLAGLAYWYAVLPLHGIVFRGMLAGIRRHAESAART